LQLGEINLGEKDMLKIVTALTSILLLQWFLACSERNKPTPFANTTEESSVPARDILANQPDFVAEEHITFLKDSNDYSSDVYKVAKKGEYYRSDYPTTPTPTILRFNKYGEPTLCYYPFEKKFMPCVHIDEPPSNPPEWFWYIPDAEILAKYQNVRLEVIGAEVVEGHECTKIKATEINSESKKDEATVFLYAAKDLRNLVIKTEHFHPHSTYKGTTYMLRNISFDVPDDLFKVLASYRKQTSNNSFNPTPR
jgi:hypothetical protein